MKILVASELPDSALDSLRGLGSEVVYKPEANTQELCGLIADASILIVGSTPITPEAISRAKMLQMIVCAGAGSAQIALDQASAQGVFVTHCPDKDSIARAELAFGLILGLDRQIVDNTNTLREGRWDRAKHLDARGLSGRTLGVIGSPAFVEAIAPRAAAFGMRLLVWMPEGDNPTPHTGVVIMCNWPRELARQSDVIVVQSPASADGDQIIDSEFLDCMQEDASLVVVGSAGTLDEGALSAAAEERNLRIAMDVFPSMPQGDIGKIRSTLLQSANFIGTPNIGSATAQARDAIAAEVVRIISAFLVSGEVINPLNICRSPATWQLVMRMRDQVGVMAAVLETIRADGINAEEITSRVFIGAKAAWCTISLDERPSTEALNSIRNLGDVLHLELRAVM